MWQTELVIILRHMIDDWDSSNYKYTDERLQELLVVGAQQLQTDCGNFLQNYVINIEQLLISPDPTATVQIPDPSAADQGGFISGRDDGFINLVSLKSAAILIKAEAKTAAGQAIMIRDGQSQVSLDRLAKSKLDIARYFEEMYDEARYLYLAGDRNAGAAIVGPFKLGSYNTSPPNYYNHSPIQPAYYPNF